MFDISLVQVTDFRSFAGTHTWVLAKDPGLYFLTGVNHENTRLSSNGTGKSSLLDAICWCLYGRTTRLLRGNDVVNYNASGCSVRVDLKIRNNLDCIVAKQNPNSLTLNGHTIDRQDLVKHIGLNLESFLYSVLIPQFGDSFFDRGPSEKLGLFSEMMELNYWLDLSKQAAKEAEGISNEIRVAENNIFKLEGRKLSLLSVIKDLTEQSDRFNEEQKARHFQYQKECEDINKSINENDRLLLEIESKIQKFGKEGSSIEESIAIERAKVKELENELNEVDKEESIIKYVIDSHIKMLTSLGSLKSTCPTCRQIVDTKHLEKETANLEDKINVSKGQLTELDLVRNEIKYDLSKVNVTLDKMISIKSDQDDEKWKLQRVCSEVKSKTESLRQESIRLVKSMRLNTAEDNRFWIMILEKRKELDSITLDMTSKEAEIAKLNEDYAAVHYWVNGFKQIRLNVIEETLQSLEIEVNNNLSAMGMSDWTVQFDVERENKSGGITKGFSVLIHDPTGRIVKYESLSGGEGQRVRLAGCFGLSNLIMERAGLVSGIEYYDELSQHLSAEGIEDMLNTLRDRAATYNRKIIVVDHHSISYPDFRGITTVVKDGKGSRITAE